MVPEAAPLKPPHPGLRSYCLQLLALLLVRIFIFVVRHLKAGKKRYDLAKNGVALLWQKRNRIIYTGLNAAQTFFGVLSLLFLAAMLPAYLSTD